MMLPQKLKTKNLALYGFLCCLLAFVILGYYALPVADDFCNKMKLEVSDPFTFTKETYWLWTGRIVSTFAIALAMSLKSISDLRFVSAFLGACFFLVPLLATLLLIRGERNRVFYLVWSAILYALWTGWKKIIGEVVYWPTGGLVYIFPYMLTLIYFYIYLRTLDSFQAASRKRVAYLAVFSFICGLLLETLSPAILTLIVGYPFFNYLLGTKVVPAKDKILLVVSNFWSCFIGTLVMVLAPGNFVRAKHSENAFKISNLADFLEKLKKLVLYFFEVNRELVSIAFYGAIVIFLLNNLSKQSTAAKNGKPLAISLLFATMSSFLPLVFVSDFASPRVSSTFGLLLVATLMSLSLCFDLPLRLQFPKIQKYTIYTLVTGLLLSVLTSAANQISLASKLQPWATERTKILSAGTPDQTLEVDEYSGQLPARLHFSDITRDTSHWINVCVADYYKVKAVKLKGEP